MVENALRATKYKKGFEEHHKDVSALMASFSGNSPQLFPVIPRNYSPHHADASALMLYDMILRGGGQQFRA